MDSVARDPTFSFDTQRFLTTYYAETTFPLACFKSNQKRIRRSTRHWRTRKVSSSYTGTKGFHRLHGPYELTAGQLMTRCACVSQTGQLNEHEHDARAEDRNQGQLGQHGARPDVQASLPMWTLRTGSER